MAITRYAGDRFTIGSSPDVEPTGVLDGAYLINTGNLSQKVLRNGTWTTLAGGGGGGSPGGSNTQVQFNDEGSFGGGTGLTFDGHKLYASSFELSGTFYDSDSSVGENGMVLTNRGQTGVHWKSIESVLSGVGGSGVANYVARWSDEDTLTSGTIFDNGDVGIGTDNPQYLLEVYGDATLNSSTATTDATLRLEAAGATKWRIKNDTQVAGGAAHTLTFTSAGAANVSINQAGYFGIGTTNPSSLLTLQSSVGGAVDIFAIKADDGGNLYRVGKDANDHGYVELFDGASTPIKVRLNSAGDSYFNGGSVGIGTTTPGEILTLDSTSNTRLLMREGGSNKGQISAGGGGLYIQNLAGDVIFRNISDADTVRIKNDGKVGIGTTNPGGKLEVDGSSVTVPLLVKAGTGANSIKFVGRSTDNISSLDFFQNNGSSGGGFFQSNGTWMRVRADGGVHFRNGNTPVTTSSDFTINGMSLGIGTTAPLALLHLKGGTATNEASHILFENTQGAKKFAVGGGGSGVTNNGLGFKNVTDNTLPMIISDSGNVGIGTASPGAPLEVYSADNQLVKITSTDAYAEITFADDTTSTRPYIGALGDNLYLYGAGVGVGTVTPAANQKLDVKFADDVNGAGVTFRNTDGSLQFQNVAGSANQFNPQVKGNSKHVNNVGLRLLGNAASGEDSGTTPLILLRGTVNDAKATTRPVLHVEDGAGDKLMAITADGNVGIGDNLIAPEHRLHVSGDAIISGVLYDSTNSSGVAGHVFTSEAGGPQWKMIEDVLSGVGGNGTENYVPKWEDSDTIGNSIIYDDGTNVGISTVTPSGKFHVYGGAGRFDVTNAATKDHHLTVSEGNATDWRPYAGSTTAALQLQSLEDLTGDARGILLAVKSEGNPELTTSEGLDINVNATVGTNNGTLAVKVQSDGNVGIGTNSTSELLHAYKAVDAAVAIAVENPNAGTDARARIQLMSNGGTATLTTYSAAFTTSNQNIADSALLRASSLSGGLGLSADGATPLRFWTNDTERIRVDSGGNVGVGTTTPKTLLEASGVIRSTHATSVTAGVGIEMLYNNTDGTGYLYSYDRDGSAYKTTRIGSESYFIADGNVGIATATPEHQFQVYGDALISGKFYDSTNSTGDKGYVLTSDDNGPLWKASGDFNGLSGNLVATGAIVDDVSGNLIATGQTLTNLIASTGTTNAAGIVTNASAIANNTTNLIATGTTNAANLVATGQFLTNALPVGADPSAVISGAATNGTATTFMRSDAAPALKDTEVTAGSYTYAAITVNAQGRLTAASDGTAPGGGTVTGTGTANYVSKWTGTNSQGNSVVYETAAGTIGIHAGTNVEGMVDVQMKMNGVDWTYGNWGEVWDSSGTPGSKFNDCVFHLDTDRLGGATGGIVGLAFSPGWQGHQNWGIYSTNESGTGSTQGDLRFVNQLNNATITERVTFKADGKVGIGTTSPSQALEVHSTIKIGKTGVTGGRLISGDSMIFQIDSDNSSTTSSYRFRTNGAADDGTELMRIQENGNVGIGTTAPSVPLEVVGADSGITISSAADSRPHLRLVNGTTNMLQLSANGDYGAIGDGTNGNRYMSFKAGSVGVNRVDPSYQLDVNGTFRVTGASILGTINSDLDPAANSTYSLGDNTNRWANIFADTLYGAGSNITALNATNLSSGTVNVDRLGSSGTRNSSTFLRGDNTWVANASGTVTSVTAGNGMTQSGTSTINPTLDVVGGTGLTAAANAINLDDTDVTADSYTYASITVDAQGRLTAASNGTAPGGGTVTGTGTAGKITKWSGTSAATDSSFLSESATTLTSTSNIIDCTTSNFQLRLSNYGRVGVGTNDATSPFISYLADSSTFSGDHALIRAYNAGNRGAKGHASGSTLFKLDFSDACAMIVNKDGKVGIGTDAPSGPLQIATDSSTTWADSTISTLDGDLIITNANTTNNSFNSLVFGSKGVGSGNIYTAARITARYPDHAGNNPSGELIFETKNDDGNLYLRMVIDRDGNVGIGTNDPTGTFKLDVIGSTKTTLVTSRTTVALVNGTVADENSYELGPGYLNLNRDDTAAARQIQFGKNGSLHSGIMTDTNGLNFVGSDGAADVTIKTDGKFGIGVVSPIEKLQVVGQLISTGSNNTSATAGAQRAIMDLSGFSATDYSARFGHFRGSTAAGAGQLRLYTDSVERVRIDASGFVGIGTDDPGYRLEVRQTSATWISRIYNTGTGNGLLVRVDSNSSDAIFSTHNGTDHLFVVKGDGNVGIGNYTPAFKLEVTGSVTGDWLSRIHNTASTNTPSGLIVKVDMSTSGGYLLGCLAATNYRFVVQNDGNVGIGTVTPSRLLHVNGGSDYNTRFTSANTRSGFVIDKPGTTTIMGSALVLADETYKLGTASYYHVVMTQAGVTSLLYQGNTKIATTSSGVTVTGTLTETSSITLKENVETYTPSLDIINKIRPVKYNRKTNKDKKEIGLIAEELAELFPELVEKDEKGNPSSVNYSRAVTVLLGGFKELYKEIEELKKRI